jgi:menaquinone-9 beta-reductase
MSTWDLIIVGAGPAGVSTALHLQQQHPELAGRTLLLEKETFPREKYCAGGLGNRALLRLARLGVQPGVPMVPVRRVELCMPNYKLEVEEPDFGGVVRRMEFDHALVRAYVQRGGMLREGAKVEAVEPGGIGVRVRLAGGEELHARAVVGADGVSGVVRRSCGFSGGVYRAQVLETDTDPAEGDPPRDTIRFDASWPDFQGYAWDFPTLVQGRELVCRGMYLIRTAGEGNLKERLRDYLALRGLDIKNYRLKPFGERGYSLSEPLARDRVLLVGEAAGIDIATGEGIAQAIAYGALAAPYLADAFRRNRLEFSDWTRRVRMSGLGKNLLGRLIMYHCFYGDRRRRAGTEGLLHGAPAILEAFARGFSGREPDARFLARLAAGLPRGLAEAARAAVRTA